MTIPAGAVDVAAQCAAGELIGTCDDAVACPECMPRIRRAVVAAFESAGFAVEHDDPELRQR